MKFYLSYWNVSNNGLEDWMTMLRMMLESAGHQVDYTDRFYAPGACHVVIEYFKPEHVAHLKQVREHGSEYVIVATEYITGETFNGYLRDDPNPENFYAKRDYWKERYLNFIECARGARAVWVQASDPRQLELYRAAVAPVPVVQLPFPYCPQFVRLTHREHKDIDVFFSGVATPHRQRLITEIAKRHSIAVFMPDLPDYLRRHYLSRSKVVLNIKQDAAWPHPSLMRYWYHLSLGSLVLNEHTEVRCPLEPYLCTVGTEQVVDACTHLIQSESWRSLQQQAYERFTREQPCVPVTDALLRQTFA